MDRLTSRQGVTLRPQRILAHAKSAGFAVAFFMLAACQPVDQAPNAVPDGSVKRIITLAPNLTELVYAAGAGDRLVGVVEYSDYPFEARSLPRVGDSFRVDFEAIHMLDPDLVLIWQSGNPVEIVSRLRELGYRVIALEPATLDAVATQIELIGAYAGTDDVAGQTASRFRDQLTRLRQRYADAPLIRVFYQIAAEPYFTVSGEHYINDAIELCGGQNVFADTADLAPSVTLEAIIAENPDAIIASIADDGAWKSGWLKWRSVRAVADANLYTINPDLISRSGPRVVQGIREICAALDEVRKKT